MVFFRSFQEAKKILNNVSLLRRDGSGSGGGSGGGDGGRELEQAPMDVASLLCDLKSLEPSRKVTMTLQEVLSLRLASKWWQVHQEFLTYIVGRCYDLLLY